MIIFTSSRELTNIPISLSVLYDQEYNNRCLFLNFKNQKKNNRRAFSETNTRIVIKSYKPVKIF